LVSLIVGRKCGKRLVSVALGEQDNIAGIDLAQGAAIPEAVQVIGLAEDADGVPKVAVMEVIEPHKMDENASGTNSPDFPRLGASCC